MKSLVEAAASILKAIERGWQRAGCPQEFSIKILEEGETNFLGMVRKPAKIALFFTESKDASPSSSSNQQKITQELPAHQQKRSHTDDEKRRASTPRPERPRRERDAKDQYENPRRPQGPRNNNRRHNNNRRERPESSHTPASDPNKKSSVNTLFRSSHRKPTSHHSSTDSQSSDSLQHDAPHQSNE